MVSDPHNPRVDAAVEALQADLSKWAEANVLGQPIGKMADTLAQVEKVYIGVMEGRGYTDCRVDAHRAWQCPFALEPWHDAFERDEPRRVCGWKVRFGLGVFLKTLIFRNAGRCPLHGLRLEEHVAVTVEGMAPPQTRFINIVTVVDG